MTVSNKNKLMLKKLFPLLTGLSLFGFTLGLSLFYIEGQFTLLSLSLASCMTIGGAMLFIALQLVMKLRLTKTLVNAASNVEANTDEKPQALRTKRWKKVALVFSMIIGSIIFLGVSHYAANSITHRWDVTESKQHTLSKNTVAFLSTLKKEVELTALYVGAPPKYLQDLLNEYERLSAGLITSQIVDPIENIAFAAKFGNVVSGKERKIIVQSINTQSASVPSTSAQPGNVPSVHTRKDVDFTNEPLTEEKLTNAIARASRSLTQVYFLNGHGEYSITNEDNAGLATFKQLLADNNIQSQPLMLGITKAIPTDCDVLIIAGPRSELTKQEESLVVNYLTSGGDALFLIEHALMTTPDKPLTLAQKKQNPSLNSIINQWGLNVQSDIVIDLSNHVGDDVGSPATKNYQQHKAITQNLDYTFYVRPRSIRVLEQRRPTIKLAAIASTASKDQSWAETNRHLDIQFDQGIDTPGPVPFSYVLLEEHPENSNTDNKPETKPSDTRIIVFTDADFLTNVYINQYSNAQMGLNVVKWLAELDYQAFPSSTAVKVERLDLTSKQKRQVVVILFFLPFFFAIAGLMVWLRTKSH